MIARPCSSFPPLHKLKILPLLSLPVLLPLFSLFNIFKRSGSPCSLSAFSLSTIALSSCISSSSWTKISFPFASLPLDQTLNIDPRRGAPVAERRLGLLAVTSTSSTRDQTLERRRSRFAQESLGSVVTDQSCACSFSSLIESRSELFVGTRSVLPY